LVPVIIIIIIIKMSKQNKKCNAELYAAPPATNNPMA
jgi:hypothetical protein